MELIDRGSQNASTFVVYRPKSKAGPSAARRFISRFVASFAPHLIEREREGRTYVEEITEKNALYRAFYQIRFF